MKPKVGRNFTSERAERVKGEVKNISLHWLQGIFETVPKGIFLILIVTKSYTSHPRATKKTNLDTPLVCPVCNNMST